ncbi:hypothetical protein Bca101_005139 [Brassica carinata]
MTTSLLTFIKNQIKSQTWKSWIVIRVPHLRGSFPWTRLGSGPLHPGGLYLGWGQSPTPSTAFDDRMGSSPPPGVEPGSMTIGLQSPYQTSYLIRQVTWLLPCN